jgi:transketolase
MATAIRALAMDAVEAAKSGHPGMPMGMADVATVLFNRFIALDPSTPDWTDRDRFVLSAGHGSMLLYALHHLIGYDDMGLDQLRAFRQIGSRTAGHPEYGHAKGIEVTTGPLGQGLATAVGMALAERMANARFGDALVSHFTYVIAGDGCLMEGISHEAIDLAGHQGLGRLIVLWDDNRITIDGDTDLSTSTDQIMRFSAAGWHTEAVDGHDNEAVARAIAAAQRDERPSLIACRTVIGFGAPNKQGGHNVHGSPLGADEVAAARAHLGWDHPPFEVPHDIYADWQNVAQRGAQARLAWQARLDASPHADAFRAFHAAPDMTALGGALNALKAQISADAPKKATRVASQQVLDIVNALWPQTVGGSADLTPSNNTRTAGMKPVTRHDYGQRYIHYGVREHAMAAAMNGIALHGPFIPYGGTFLVFSDYSRPALRIAAIMGLRVIHVMTHDSIGLGEDGPTHQPVEHVSALRAIPNLNVLRPADTVETAECWQIALSSMSTPSVLALTRQNLMTVRTTHTAENLSARGAYVLREADGPREITLMASGSEVEIAVKAADMLTAEGRRVAVVSCPCLDLFASQPADYRASVLGSAPRVAVEAAVRQSWDRWIGETGAFVGMASFGASGPYEALYRHFGITPEAVASTARNLMG